MDKNEKVENKSNTELTSDHKPAKIDQAPEPRGKYGRQVDTDLDNY